ncbi:hypothetical protein EDB87DRAFT_221800 [Lactarius vividus]|nr:hypothetical protein EDB87DRAFT_221800 [Lactarius vividus]
MQYSCVHQMRRYHRQCSLSGSGAVLTHRFWWHRPLSSESYVFKSRLLRVTDHTPSTPCTLIQQHTMSRLCSHRQYISMTMTAPKSTPLPVLADTPKSTSKQRRKAGRERHEERKTQTKEIASQRYWRRLDRPGLQEQLRNDGTLAFTGRNLDNFRELASHVRGDSDTEDDDEVDEATETTEDVPPARSTSGAALLAMARPAKTRRPPPQTTDGEAFEVVEIDGRFVALDEDGWEILPDESAEASLLYSDVVRGSAR